MLAMLNMIAGKQPPMCFGTHPAYLTVNKYHSLYFSHWGDAKIAGMRDCTVYAEILLDLLVYPGF